MERPELKSKAKELYKNRLVQIAAVAASLGAFLAFGEKTGQEVQANTELPDAQTPHTLRLENPPNQEEYDRIKESSTQANTKVQGYIEVPTDQQIQEGDLQAFREILTGVQQWFYENIGATFEVDDIQFMTKPEILQFPQTTDDFFKDARILPRVGAFVDANGLGTACDRDNNRTDFLLITVAGWREQNRNTLVPIPAHDLRFAGPCLGNDGLGAAYFGESYLDNTPQDEAVRAIALDIAIANTLGDTNAPNLAKFLENPQFSPAQIEQLRNSPLFTRRNPNWQPPKEPIQLFAGWNAVAVDINTCRPIDQALQSLTDRGISATVWAFQTHLRRWQAYDPQLAQVSDLEEICPLQVVWIKPTQPANWQPGQ